MPALEPVVEVPSTFVRMRLLVMPLPDLFMSLFIESVLLLFMSVLDEVLGVALIEPVDDGVSDGVVVDVVLGVVGVVVIG